MQDCLTLSVINHGEDNSLGIHLFLKQNSESAEEIKVHEVEHEVGEQTDILRQLVVLSHQK